MTSQHPPIWNQLHKYLSSEDMQSIGESSIIDYLRTTYGEPQQKTVQEDLTEFVFDIHERKVHFWQQGATGELIGVGGVQTLLCPSPGVVATISLPRSITINLLGILTRGVTGAVAAATAEAFVSSVSLSQTLCLLCAPTCFCLPVPAIAAGPTVTG